MLSRFQAILEQIYDLEMPVDVSDFYVDSARFQELAEQGAASVAAPEQLLVMEEEGGASVAVFIDDDVLERLEQSKPLENLTRDNRADFCLLAEGVSHFVYFTWKAHQQHPVTQLEMELQAEVDKYVTCFLAHWEQDRGRFPDELKEQLFQQVSFRAGLDAESASRYQTANRLALQYCDYLERSFLRDGRVPGAVPELRRFYRLTHQGKLAHIARM